jgi:hypothetical protein
MIRRDAAIAVVKKGLRQMGRDGLLRLKSHVEDGKPLVLDGSVTKNGVP